jgi:PadR family transcriptional regulator AphA
MPKINQTQFSILGLLSLKPMSGYDIKQSIQNSTQHFWNESYGNLYPTLQKLVTEKYVTANKQGNSARGRIEYALTGTGKKHLTTWLNQPLHPAVVRDELLLKIFFGKNADKKHLLSQLNKEAKLMNAEITKLKKITRELPQKHAKHKHLPYWLLTIECGLKEFQARLSWCQESIKTITKL